jgi:dTDP-4-amino-4,6-dideoxygalactose transaminase
MVIYAEYDPVFIDNKKNSFETNTIELINKYQEEIAFVVVTHLNGLNKEIFEIKNKIDQINKNRKQEDKIYLVEDTAVSFGAKYKNVFCGAVGDFSILSFNIMKNITSLTGGALVDNINIINSKKINFSQSKVSIKDITKKIFFVFLLQFLNSKIIFPFFFVFIKFAYKRNINFFLRKYRTDFQTYISNSIPFDFLKKISNFQLFLLSDQLEDIEFNNNIRIENSKYLYENLKDNKNLLFPQKIFNQENIYIDFPILCKKKEYKDYIFLKSFDSYVDIKNYYYTSCDTQEIYFKYKDIDCENAKFIAENILMVPVNKSQNRRNLDKIVKLFN